MVHHPVARDEREEHLEVEVLAHIVDEDQARFLADAVPDELVVEQLIPFATDIDGVLYPSHQLTHKALAAASVAFAHLALLAVHGNNRTGDAGILSVHGHITDGAELRQKVLRHLGLLIGISLAVLVLAPREVGRVLEKPQEIAHLTHRGDGIGVVSALVQIKVHERRVAHHVDIPTRVSPYVMGKHVVLQLLNTAARNTPEDITEIEVLTFA